MNLVALKIEFTTCVGKLLVHASDLGFALSLEEAKRGLQQAQWNASHCSVLISGTRCEAHIDNPVHRSTGGHQFHAVGIRNSLHNIGLAVDCLIWVPAEGGPWKISNDTDLYGQLALYWKGLHPLARAGFDFGDLGHFSFEHEGRK